MASPFSSNNAANQCKLLLVSVVAIYLIFAISLPNQLTFSPSEVFSLFIKQTPLSISQSDADSPTHLNHIAFAINHGLRSRLPFPETLYRVVVEA